MTKPRFSYGVSTVVGLALLLTAGAAIATAELDDRQFSRQTVKAATECYKTAGVEAALQQIEEGYVRFTQKYRTRAYISKKYGQNVCLIGPDKYYAAVWQEAQFYSGHADEEWARNLFIYLLKRTRRKQPATADRIPTTDCILIGNIMHDCFDLGKVAEMKGWALELETSLQKHEGMDLNGESYEDLGPIFPFVPDARKRAFPLKRKDFPESVYPQPHDLFIHYALVYAVGYVADACISNADWVRAAELYLWLLQYASEILKTPKQLEFPSEMGRIAMERTMQMADICVLHDHPEEGVRFYDDYIEKAESYFNTHPVDLVNAKLQRELLHIPQGRMSEAAVEIADRADHIVSTQKSVCYSRWGRFKIRLARARVYYEAGRKDEAWAMVDELLALGAEDVNPRHRERMLCRAIELALLDGGTRPELEAWLLEALRHERELGDKFAELPLYAQYAEFLCLKGRFSEAEVIQLEAVRLAHSLALPDRLARDRRMLAEIRRKRDAALAKAAATEATPTIGRADGQTATQPGRASSEGGAMEDAVADDSGARFIGIDLQPRASVTVPLVGKSGCGRFFLNNPSPEARRGTLRIGGPVTNLMWRTEAILSAEAAPELGEAELERTLTIPSGECRIVDLLGVPLADDESIAVRCDWLPEGAAEPSMSASWVCQAGLKQGRTAVIDAQAVEQNPFYLVPVYHTLQRDASAESEVVDLAVSASAPVRVEVYDARTSGLVYIDANGDGDFEDGGDLIASDTNDNNWPDLTIPQGEELSSFVMYIVPSELAGSAEALELEIRLLNGDEWILDAIDVIEIK